MFCKECGQEVKGGSFCGNCGTKVDAPTIENDTQTNQGNTNTNQEESKFIKGARNLENKVKNIDVSKIKNIDTSKITENVPGLKDVSEKVKTLDKKKKMGLIAAAAIVVICIVFLIASSGSPSKRALAFTEDSMYMRVDDLRTYFHKDEVDDEDLEDMSSGIANSFGVDAEENLDVIADLIDAMNIELEVTKKEDVDEDRFELIVEWYADEDIKVKDVKEITISMKSKPMDLDDDETLTMVKIGSKWYVSTRF